MFHVEHLTSGLPGRSLVLAKVTSPVGVTLARSLRSRLARLFHVEHWTTTPARTKCGWSRWRPHWEWTILPPSSVRTEPCSNVPRGTLDLPAKSRCGQPHVRICSCPLSPLFRRCLARLLIRCALGKKQGTDEISLVSVPSFGTDTYRRHLFAREPCSNVPRETRHAWTCRTKCRTCESGPHSHLALCRFTRPSAGASHECSTWNVLASTGSVGTAWLRDQTPGAS